MNELKKCLIGRDSDDGGAFIGFMIGVAIVIVIVMIVVMLIIYAGAIIGGFHSLKNYFLSFKNNVIDSNRAAVPAA